MMQLPGNQVSSSSGQRWLHSNELKTDHQLKIVSTIRSVFAFRVTFDFRTPVPYSVSSFNLSAFTNKNPKIIMKKQ